MRAYFLTSARLGFGTWTPEDLPLALGLWGDPEVTRFTGGRLSPARVADRLSTEIANLDRSGIQYWPIFLRDTGDHVGCCGLRPHAATGGYELGFQLRRLHWRHGFAREAAQTVIAHAFESLGVETLRAGHHPENQASRHLLQSMGFRYSHEEFYPPTELMEPVYTLSARCFTRSVGTS